MQPSRRSRRACTRAACDSCRDKKAKCDGGSPCSRCQGRGAECKYKKTRSRCSKRDLRLGLEKALNRAHECDIIFDALRDEGLAGHVLSQIQDNYPLARIVASIHDRRYSHDSAYVGSPGTASTTTSSAPATQGHRHQDYFSPLTSTAGMSATLEDYCIGQPSSPDSGSYTYIVSPRSTVSEALPSPEGGFAVQGLNRTMSGGSEMPTMGRQLGKQLSFEPYASAQSAQRNDGVGSNVYYGHIPAMMPPVPPTLAPVPAPMSVAGAGPGGEVNNRESESAGLWSRASNLSVGEEGFSGPLMGAETTTWFHPCPCGVDHGANVAGN